MDYLCVGSDRFAQVGNPEFFEKNEVEMNYLLEYLEPNFPIPEDLISMCLYKEKWFRHDFGDYSEIVLIYKDRILEGWKENDPDKFYRFWDWFNEIESVNLESELITQCIHCKYFEKLETKKYRQSII